MWLRNNKAIVTPTSRPICPAFTKSFSTPCGVLIMRPEFPAWIRTAFGRLPQCAVPLGLLALVLLVGSLVGSAIFTAEPATAQDATSPPGATPSTTDGAGSDDAAQDAEPDATEGEAAQAPASSEETAAPETPDAQTTDGDEANEPGQADLDEATIVKLTADSMGDLENVTDLCEAALSKGLSEENRKYAEDLLTATLYEQANRLSRLIFDQQPVDPRWPRIREICMGKLKRAVEVRDNQGNVHLLIARLQALPNGDRDAAKAAVDKALPLLADDPDQLSQAYQVRATVGSEKDQVLADLNKAIELNPRNLDAWRARGVLYMSSGEPEKALDDLQELLNRDPDDLLAHQAIAQTLRQLNKYDEAKEHLDRVLEADPDSALAYNLRARIEEEQGNLDEAIENLNEAIRLQPQNLGAILTRARLRAAEEQFDLARSDVDRALQLQPRLPQAILLRSLISAGQQRFGDAIGDLQQLLRGQEGDAAAEIKMQMAAYYEMDQRPRRAIEIYTEIVDQNEENWVALRRRGDALLSIGDQAKAVSDYEAALKIQPEETGLLNNLAWVLATSPDDELRDGKRAVELASKACELTKYEQAHILSTLAAAHAEAGQFEKAIEWSGKAVVLDPDTPQLANELEAYRQEKPWRERQETQENTAALQQSEPSDDLPVFDGLEDALGEPEEASGAPPADQPEETAEKPSAPEN
jgi:tetratricopeptide (TPR) repeat protein